jgi:hypothetical protein
MTQTTTDDVPARATKREWIGLAVLTLAALLYAMDLTVPARSEPAGEGVPPEARAAAD